MQIRCPVCDYSRDINTTKIPPTAEFATCPKCRHRFRFRALDLDTIERPVPLQPNPEHEDVWDAVDSLQDRWYTSEDANQSTEDADRYPPSTSIPWEAPQRQGYVQSFFRTTAWVLLQPASFFTVLNGRPSLFPAFAFAMIFWFFQHVLNVIWTHLAGVFMQERLIQRLGEEFYAEAFANVLGNSLFSPSILSAPFLLAIQLFIITVIIHGILLLVEPRRANFGLSFKVVSYASAGLTLTILPIIGSLIAPAWYVALLLVGCRNAFQLTWGRAFLVLSPLFVVIYLGTSVLYSTILTV